MDSKEQHDDVFFVVGMSAAHPKYFDDTGIPSHHKHINLYSVILLIHLLAYAIAHC